MFEESDPVLTGRDQFIAPLRPPFLFGSKDKGGDNSSDKKKPFEHPYKIYLSRKFSPYLKKSLDFDSLA